MTEPHDDRIPSYEENGRSAPPAAHQPLITGLQSSAASDWTRRELAPAAETATPARRERLFPRKVLIGWAMFALVTYFGVRMVGTIIKATVREAVAARATPGSSNTRGRFTIVLPNGERIVIDRDNSVRTVPKPPDTPPPKDQPAPAATAPQPAPAATATQPAPPAPPAKKR